MLHPAASFFVSAWFVINWLVILILIILGYYTEERISTSPRKPESRTVVI